MDAIAATEFLARSTTLTSVGWIGYIIIGGIAGWIAERITHSNMGITANVLLGIVARCSLTPCCAWSTWCRRTAGLPSSRSRRLGRSCSSGCGARSAGGG